MSQEDAKHRWYDSIYGNLKELIVKLKNEIFSEATGFRIMKNQQISYAKTKREHKGREKSHDNNNKTITY